MNLKVNTLIYELKLVKHLDTMKKCKKIGETCRIKQKRMYHLKGFYQVYITF